MVLVDENLTNAQPNFGPREFIFQQEKWASNHIYL
jgi:hypothetical protein